MIKAELIENLSIKSRLNPKDTHAAINLMLDHISETIAQGDRAEIRGFGSFSVHVHVPREARNPKTGGAISLPERRIPHFKPGKELRERVNAGRMKGALRN